MPAKFVAGLVFFGALGTLCSVMFFANLGSGNASGVGAGRAAGLQTSTIGLIGAISGYGLAIYVLVFWLRNRNR